MASTPLFLLRTLLECLGKPDKRREERDQSGRSFTKSVRSVMGITSRRMEGAARHMELPSTITSLSNCSHKYEYMFANNSDVAISKRGFTQGCRVAALGDFMSARAPILTAI